MNVGMTRARCKLLLVGDSSTLGRHPFFGELLDLDTAHDTIFTLFKSYIDMIRP
jgi:superfamily I DNA and/or RNA helicase